MSNTEDPFTDGLWVPICLSCDELRQPWDPHPTRPVALTRRVVCEAHPQREAYKMLQVSGPMKPKPKRHRRKGLAAGETK